MTTPPPADRAMWKPGIAASADAVQPAPVGAAAPAAVLQTVKGDSFNLAEAYARAPTVLIFYRGGWCPYCNAHLQDLASIESQLRDMGYQLLAVSPDSPAELNKTMTKDKLGYMLLSDSDMTLAKAFGLAFAVDQPTLDRYSNYGIDLIKSSGGKNPQLLPVPAVYIIDQQGVIRYAHWNPDYTTRLSGSEVLDAAKRAMQQK